MLQRLTAGWLFAIAFATTAVASLAYIWCRFFSRQGLPRNLPWAGADGTYLSRAKSTWRSFFGLREVIQDGYYTVSRNT